MRDIFSSYRLMDFFTVIVIYSFLKLEVVSSSCLKDNVFDYIIVGSGSSGSVVATRLSENAKTTVLLLEAGREPLPDSYIPLLSVNVFSTEMNWNYTSVPQKNGGYLYKDNMLPLTRGRALGGTSSINAMAYTRGNRLDYDQWSGLGNPGWDYESVYKYLLKLEDYQVPRSRYDDKYHHEGGPLTASLASFKTPLAIAFLQSGFEIDQPIVDYNAEYQTGFMYPPVTIKNGARCSTYSCYLQPVTNRSNLFVLTNAFVTKIIINDDKIATGVAYEREFANCTARARKEVIISAGAFNSPQLLMLSGVGPRETLEQFNISLIKDLPGVGQNLQDHPSINALSFAINQTISYITLLKESDKYLDIWENSRTGPMTCPLTLEGIAYLQSKFVSHVSDWPDIEVFLSSSSGLKISSDDVDQITFNSNLLRAKSRGEVTLRSDDPHDSPLIDPKFLSHSDDIDVLVIGLDFIRRIADTKAFKQYGASLINNEIINNCNLSSSDSDEFNKCLVRGLLGSGNHAACTCKMGPISDKMSVVDSRLRVHGIKQLRVVDASIMPNLVSAHPNVACIMIGEKASDLIKEDFKE